ncbi:hypothetical protein BO94DRAFT_530944 [Aspergillus sclerotioniger CBS 115572]|uniref:Uncharacterized protein n=1 Tax=Aspergillus sclerotioniger CBS 115572 TaxID=1450535 RepID=A0A317X8X2_9EURO|nr:hypothetical protein BO94DRAFT_530944 [Aspergillus sclerotioniger CBS 115572]PWY95056.1 hypothetical protein BO94DRAFT_530944 [Aspergillus sclerotioniger CBS 115572]
MGTRGLFFIRCCGRYFVYYNQLDSYPEGLGVAIVNEIPQDPEKYQEWFQFMRGVYAQLVKQLETQALPVTIQTSQHEDSSVALIERYTKSFWAVDDRLELPPLQAVLPGLADLCIEWTYTLDLDREVLTIDNSLHLSLNKIPHGDAWIKYLGTDHRHRRVADSCTPKELVADLIWKPEIDSASKERYHQFDVCVIALETFYNQDDISVTRESLLDATFSLINDQYRELLDGYVLEWEPSHFAFREIAFAVLSVAAGEVSFECIRNFDQNHIGEGYYLDRRNVSPSLTASCHPVTILPRFLYESHLPGVRPGSAPEGRMYWLKNVLVYLASGLDSVEVEEASVAEVVEAGLKQGLVGFYAMVFSIIDVVLLHVQKGSDGTIHVNRSPLMALIDFDDENSRYANGPRTGTRGFQVQKRQAVSAFLATLRFFDAATHHDLKGTHSTIFPNEVLGAIMKLSDTQTYRALGTVSAYSRRLSDRELRLNDEYAVVGFDSSEGSFILEDLQSGKKIHSKLEKRTSQMWPSTARSKGLNLSPVIGIESSTRRTVLDDLRLCFSEATSRSLPYSKKIEMPKQECHYFSTDYHDSAPERLFDIEDYMYVGSLECGWGKYLANIIQSIGAAPSRMYSSALIRGASYSCLLPPKFRQLRMDYYHNGLNCFIRHAHDESPQEWDVMMKYALHHLHSQKRPSKTDNAVSVPGHPMILAFSTRIRLFFYVYQCAEAPTLGADAHPYLVEAASQCTNPEPSRRLIPLIAGGETIDLKEKKWKDEFERWIKVFCGDI